ncbi:MAG: ribosome biogenesis GTPase YlqF [Christensenellales bacterium]
MQIQWYPGHMTKAKRMLQEQLRRVDAVLILLDARIPASSLNPDIEAMMRDKKRLILLNKADLADPDTTVQWKRYYKQAGMDVLELTSTRKNARKQVLSAVEAAVKGRVDAMAKKGVKKIVRVMVAGVPNVGKSTLINMLAGGAMTRTADRPGVTRGRQWIRMGDYLELLDTPGLLWPKFDDPVTGMHLAFCGSIRDEITEAWQLCCALLDELKEQAPQQLAQRYKLASLADTGEEILIDISKKRGFLLRGGQVDTERGARVVLDEFRDGRIGRISLEKPPEGGAA